MSRRARSAALAAALLIAGPLHAAVDVGFVRGDGGAPGSFLDQPVSARQVGLGEAFTGVADDASALQANAAGLVQLKSPDVVTLYSSLYEDTSYGSLMYAQPLKDLGGAFGVGVVSMGSQGYQKTDINRQSLGTYNQSEQALYLAHARQWRGFGVGGTLKFVRQRIDVYSGSGFGADVSGFWPMNRRLSLGVNVQNLIAPSVKLKTQSETYARSLQMGARYWMNNKWAVTGDLEQTQTRTLTPLVGTEVGVGDTVVLRGGLNERQLSLGIGFKINQWTLDYAIGFQGALIGQDQLGTSHRFGLHFAFGNQKNDQHVDESGPQRDDVKAALAALQNEVNALDVSTPTAARVQAIEALVKANVGVNRRTMPVEILQADGQLKLLKGQIADALAPLTYAARVLPDDATQQKNLERALARISPELRKTWADQLLAEAQDLFNQQQYVEAASKSLVSDALWPQDAADILNKRARLALLPSINLRQTTITDALLREHVDEAYDHALSAFQVDPLNTGTQHLVDNVRAALEAREQTSHAPKGKNLAAALD